MCSLKALCEAVELATEDDLEAVLRLPSKPFEPVRVVTFPIEDQDELTARGWVVLIGENEIEPTAAGRYWLARYLRTNTRKVVR